MKPTGSHKVRISPVSFSASGFRNEGKKFFLCITFSGGNSDGLGRYRAVLKSGRVKIDPVFFRANNFMARPGPNSGWTGLAHQVGPNLTPLLLGSLDV